MLKINKYQKNEESGWNISVCVYNTMLCKIKTNSDRQMLFISSSRSNNNEIR